MYVDGSLAQLIGAGEGHRWTRFPSIVVDNVLTIDSIPSQLLLLRTIQLLKVGIPSLLLPQYLVDHCCQVFNSNVADNIPWYSYCRPRAKHVQSG